MSFLPTHACASRLFGPRAAKPRNYRSEISGNQNSGHRSSWCKKSVTGRRIGKAVGIRRLSTIHGIHEFPRDFTRNKTLARKKKRKIKVRVFRSPVEITISRDIQPSISNIPPILSRRGGSIPSSLRKRHFVDDTKE